MCHIILTQDYRVGQLYIGTIIYLTVAKQWKRMIKWMRMIAKLRSESLSKDRPFFLAYWQAVPCFRSFLLQYQTRLHAARRGGWFSVAVYTQNDKWMINSCHTCASHAHHTSGDWRAPCRRLPPQELYCT